MKAIVLCTDGKNVSSRKPHTNHSPNSHSDEKIIYSRMSKIHLKQDSVLATHRQILV